MLLFFALLNCALWCRQDRALEGGVTFNVVTIVGSRTEPLLIIAARQLAEKLSGLGYSRWSASTSK